MDRISRTATLAYQPADGLSIRLELRHDQTKTHAFFGGDVAGDGVDDALRAEPPSPGHPDARRDGLVLTSTHSTHAWTGEASAQPLRGLALPRPRKP